MPLLELFIARRYLLSRRRVRFVNLISVISVVGITAGVAALLIALSVFNGFNSVVTSVLVGFDPHLRIERQGNISAARYMELTGVLSQNPRISSYAPYVSGKAMLVARSFNRVVWLRGVDARRIAGVSGLREHIVLGSLSLADTAGSGAMVVGLTLADRLGIVVGDEVSVISPYGFQSALSLGTPEMMKFRVAGIFESDNKEYDASYAYISISRAQRLFNCAGMYSGIDVRTATLADADRVKEELAPRMPSGTVISTWYDLHKSLYSVMKIERWSAYVLLSLIVIVATFNMLGSLTMTVIEKRRDIAVLRAMGMGTGRITRIFMVEGMIIGIAGTIAGVVIGLVVLWLQLRYQFFPLDPTIYIIPAIPVQIQWPDFVSIAAASLGLSFLAAYIPARRASRTQPAESLRWE